MSVRILLLNELDRRATAGEIPATEATRKNVRDAVTHALAALILVTPLAVARTLTTTERDMFAATIREALSFAENKALSALWEPARGKLDESVEQGIRRDNVELLMGTREPYQGLPRTLAEALSTPAARKPGLRVAVECLAPVADLKAALKAWDPKFKALAKAPRRDLAQRLLALLDGEPPVPEPVKTPTARATRRR